MPTGAGAYLVTLRDVSTVWTIWVPGGSATVTLPALPASLSAWGLTPGNPVTWTVRAIGCPGLAWSSVSLRRLAVDATGEAQTQPLTFTP